MAPLSVVDQCLQEKSSVRELMVEEAQLAKRDLQYRLKLAEDEQTERLKTVNFVYFKLTKHICLSIIIGSSTCSTGCCLRPYYSVLGWTSYLAGPRLHSSHFSQASPSLPFPPSNPSPPLPFLLFPSIPPSPPLTLRNRPLKYS